MKFAVIADIHGNHLALEAVLADMDRLGIDGAVNLGDHFSGPLEAGLTAEILIKHNFPSICGNHDRYLIEQKPEEMEQTDVPAYHKLKPEHLDWIRSLPVTLTYNDYVFLCHGTPTNDEKYWLDDVLPDASIAATPIQIVEQLAQDISTSLILCAHTHIPRLVHLPDGRVILNPGSVGCPAYDDDVPIYHKVQTGTPNASYAIAEKAHHGWDVTFRSVPYDHMAMSEIAKKNGRDDWARALATGWLD